jgi:hypothetical protein
LCQKSVLRQAASPFQGRNKPGSHLGTGPGTRTLSLLQPEAQSRRMRCPRQEAEAPMDQCFT